MVRPWDVLGCHAFAGLGGHMLSRATVGMCPDGYVGASCLGKCPGVKISSKSQRRSKLSKRTRQCHIGKCSGDKTWQPWSGGGILNPELSQVGGLSLELCHIGAWGPSRQHQGVMGKEPWARLFHWPVWLTPPPDLCHHVE